MDRYDEAHVRRQIQEAVRRARNAVMEQAMIDNNNRNLNDMRMNDAERGNQGNANNDAPRLWFPPEPARNNANRQARQ